MEISVVVPVRDEAENVLPLVREIQQVLGRRADCEVIYVDDGSRDSTFERLQEARREILPGLRILRHERSEGQSAALRSGVEAARGVWIATLDGDGQNDPRDVPRLIEALRAAPPDVHLVCGLRLERRDGWLRRIASRVANGVRRRVLRDDAPDSASGLKLFRRDTFLEIPYFDHMHRFLPALMKMRGACVVGVESRHRPRLRGRSKYGVFERMLEGIVDLAGVYWLVRRHRVVRSVELAPAEQQPALLRVAR